MKYRFDEAQVGALWINNSATASSGITHIYNDSTDNQKLKIGRSNILGNNVAMSIDREGTVSGSFTGSFGGDGSAITGVVAEWDGTRDGDASITGDLVLGGSTTVANETLAIESNAGDDQNIVLVWGDSTATGQPYLGLGILNDATASITAGARGTGETCLSVYTSPSTETERMRINSDGNVGIGVSDPQVQLDVVGSSADKSLQLRSGDSAAGTDAVQVIFSYNGKPYNDAGYAHSIRTRHHSGQAANNAIDFYLWTNADDGDVLGTNRVMIIDGTGDVICDAMQQYISVTMTSDTDPDDGEYNPFDEDNGGGTTFNTNASNGVTFDSSNGRFTVAKAGDYEITAVMYMNGTSAALTTFKLRKEGSTDIWSAETYVHGSVDPVERTINGIFTLAASDYVEVKVHGNDLSVRNGSGVTIKRVA